MLKAQPHLSSDIRSAVSKKNENLQLQKQSLTVSSPCPLRMHHCQCRVCFSGLRLNIGRFWRYGAFKLCRSCRRHTCSRVATGALPVHDQFINVPATAQVWCRVESSSDLTHVSAASVCSIRLARHRPPLPGSCAMFGAQLCTILLCGVCQITRICQCSASILQRDYIQGMISKSPLRKHQNGLPMSAAILDFSKHYEHAI
jgi:hypothetical protein